MKAEVLENYKNEVRSKAAETMTAEDMEYIEEDLTFAMHTRNRSFQGICRNCR